jgi:nicotinic acid phosphoribosyltransferase
MASDYRKGVQANIQSVIEALGGDAHRAFEVGMRAATCIQQHMIVLEECRAKGILKTSNVWAAWKLYLIPVGTTGHEHQERWRNDLAGFRAIRDMRAEPPSYLFDTFDPIRSGIPAAFRVIREDPNRPCSIRFDSGDQDAQFKDITTACLDPASGWPKYKLTPNLIFEDGYTAEKTVTNETLCEQDYWPRERRMYGYGGFFVSAPHPSPYHRDRVSAAFKLSWSVGPCKKFSGTPGKGSLPGRPVILRRSDISISVEKDFENVNSLIAQEGEQVCGFEPLTIPDLYRECDQEIRTALSPKTRLLNAMLAERKEYDIGEIREGLES